MQVQLAMQPDLDPQAVASLEAFGKERDRQILRRHHRRHRGAGHRVGADWHRRDPQDSWDRPTKMRLLLARGRCGYLHDEREDGPPQGDELQDVFNAFNDMVNTPRTRQARVICAASTGPCSRRRRPAPLPQCSPRSVRFVTACRPNSTEKAAGGEQSKRALGRASRYRGGADDQNAPRTQTRRIAVGATEAASKRICGAPLGVH